jgi:hypothetical protein
MIRPGDTIANPITGERFKFTHVQEDLLAFDFALAPGGSGAEQRRVRDERDPDGI